MSLISRESQQMHCNPSIDKITRFVISIVLEMNLYKCHEQLLNSTKSEIHQLNNEIHQLHVFPSCNTYRYLYWILPVLYIGLVIFKEQFKFCYGMHIDA